MAEIYAEKTSGRLDVAFNARDALFYLVRQDKVDILNGISGNMDKITVEKGYPVMEYTDHLVYDTLTNQLFLTLYMKNLFLSYLLMKELGA